MLTASMTTYFSVLDLGFGGAIVKFVAQYRAHRDVDGLNEIASTLFVDLRVDRRRRLRRRSSCWRSTSTHVFNITPDAGGRPGDG